MSAIDYIKGGKARGIKKNRLDVPWSTSGSLLILDGQPAGQIEWDKSRFLRTGNHTDYYAFVSGSYYVLPQTSMVGYVEPPKVKWGMPIPAHSDDDGDDDE